MLIFASENPQWVIIVPPRGQGPIRYSTDVAVALPSLRMMHGVDQDPLPLLIADSLVPTELPFPTLIVSSPGRLSPRHLKNRLNSYSPARLYMPIPTKEELHDMRQVAFSGVSKEAADQRMQLWGPIPRHVLGTRSIARQRALLGAAEAGRDGRPH